MNVIDTDFVAKMEAAYFRTNEDVGANLNALLIWNCVREHLKLPKLDLNDLPAHCSTHDEHHIIRPNYGCKRTKQD